MDSRIKKTKINIIYSILLQIIKIFLLFLGKVIFVRKLGAEYLGINGLFSNLLSILSIADLGITTALMYGLYKPLAENDTKKITQYINFFKKVYLVIAIIVAITGIALIPFLKYIVNLPSDIPHIYLYYVILLANSVLSYLFIDKTTLLMADQKAYVINKVDIIFQIILFLLQIIVLTFSDSYTLYLLCNLLCTFIENLIKIKKAKEIYPYIKDNSVDKLDKKDKKEIITNVKSLMIYKIGGIIQSNTDNILISIFVGTITVGYYSIYTSIISTITSFITLIFNSIKSSLGNFINDKNKSNEDKKEIFDALEIYNFWLISFCSICFLVLVPDFITLLFGKEYLLGNGILIAIVLNFYTSNIRQNLWAYRETTGIFTETKYITMVTAIINVFLSIILGKLYGVFGIVIATVISRLVYAWWREPQILYNKVFNAGSKEYIIKYILRVFFVAFLYILIKYLVKFIRISNLIILLLMKAIICLAITFISILLIYRKSNAMKILKNKILKKVD